ncbi:Peroxisome biogenesis factor 1 [Gracilaria domingensis]|nr:Peroxisome biogenesis factor 1 [Gracilaria domingensis]
MDLIVALRSENPASPASSLRSNCFVSLPSTVVASLSELTPFAPLLIIRLIPKNKKDREPIYVACSGGTTQSQDQIALHPHHATTLHLKQGDVVTATVAERISNYPRRCVDVAFLRPVSYDQCQAKPSTSQPFQLASQHFSTLNVTANFLETSVLSQVRLVYENLVVPIQLPAKECIYVRVKRMDTTGDQNCPYALLTPSSQLSVEPPPINPLRSRVKQVFGFFRALCRCKSELQAISPLFRSHAILPADGSPDVRYAYISRKDVENNNNAVPVAFICHEAIPKAHIWIPTHVCHALSITPLVPVLVEEVAAFQRGQIDLFAEPSNFSNGLVTFSELKTQSGVYFDSMLLRGLKVRIAGERTLSASKDQTAFLWDIIDLKKSEHEDEDEIFEDSENAILEDVVSSEDRIAAASKRQMVNGFCGFPEQTVCLIESSSRDVPSTRERNGRLFLRLSEKDETSLRALKSLTASSKQLVHELMKHARSVFSMQQTEPASPSSVAIQGAIGAGKTYVCSTVAWLLQDLALVRTVWVRCKVHSKDAPEVSISRIRAAFRGAIDGGPGLIVLDDVDSWIQVSKDSADEKTQSRLRNTRGTRICVALERELRRKLSKPVLVLMSCKDFKQLNKTIRSPGLIHSIRNVQLPDKLDRILLFRFGLKRCMESSVNDSLCGKDFNEETLENLATVSDGFSPRDIKVSLSRAQLQAKAHSASNENAGVLDSLNLVLKTMIPVNRIGIKFTKPSPRDELSWQIIGGLSRAKQQLWEALQLPTLHPDVFKDVPLRLPHGILLFGPPGCGKTMLAKTAAFESKMRCIVVRGPELLSKYVGESEAEVRHAFDRAGQAAPCVLLFDEFDALAPRRGGYGTGVSDRVVNTLLACLDGAERLSEGVYILATTSRPEVIDPALLRPGRLDKWIYLDVPSTPDERLDILRKLYINYFEDFNGTDAILEQVARKTDGYTGADLGSIINDAYMFMQRSKATADGTIDREATCTYLEQAFSESRPSLSRRQRNAYQRVMARFTAHDDYEPNGGAASDLEATQNPLRSMVALK